MSLSPRLLHRFQDLAKQPDNGFDLFECLLLVSKVLKPSGNIEEAKKRTQALIERLQSRFDSLILHDDPLEAKVATLQTIMVVEEGFYGDVEAYDDLDHMNIFRVLDQKCATATTLSIFFLHCCRACGWSVNAIGFPGYHLLAINEGDRRALIDPFEKCAQLDAYGLRQLIKVIGGAEAELTPSFYEVVADKTLAIRHLNTVKIHFVRAQQTEKAVDICDCLCALDPTSAAFWRESGLLKARIGQTEDAIHALNIALKYTQDGETIRHTRQIILDLQNHLDI